MLGKILRIDAKCSLIDIQNSITPILSIKTGQWSFRFYY